MKPVKVVFLDGVERSIVEAREDHAGRVWFISTVGERLPASQVLQYKPVAIRAS